MIKSTNYIIVHPDHSASSGVNTRLPSTIRPKCFCAAKMYRRMAKAGRMKRTKKLPKNKMNIFFEKEKNDAILL